MAHTGSTGESKMPQVHEMKRYALNRQGRHDELPGKMKSDGFVTYTNEFATLINRLR